MDFSSNLRRNRSGSICTLHINKNDIGGEKFRRLNTDFYIFFFVKRVYYYSHTISVICHIKCYYNSIMASLGAYKKYFSPVTLFIIFMVGILLRFAFFESATFGYDQARDAFASIGIFGDDPIKIQGPTTDIKGLFHGPLYWYLTAPFYFFSGGDPLAARLILVMINVLSIFFIFHFSKELFKNTTMALISAFLFAVSFEAVQYSRWLSNPPPALLTIAIFYYGLWLSLQKKSIGIGLMFLGLALSVQFQFFLVYLVPFFLVGAVSFLRKSKFSKLFSKTNIILKTLIFLKKRQPPQEKKVQGIPRKIGIGRLGRDPKT